MSVAVAFWKIRIRYSNGTCTSLFRNSTQTQQIYRTPKHSRHRIKNPKTQQNKQSTFARFRAIPSIRERHSKSSRPYYITPRSLFNCSGRDLEKVPWVMGGRGLVLRVPYYVRVQWMSGCGPIMLPRGGFEPTNGTSSRFRLFPHFYFFSVSFVSIFNSILVWGKSAFVPNGFCVGPYPGCYWENVMFRWWSDYFAGLGVCLCKGFENVRSWMFNCSEVNVSFSKKVFRVYRWKTLWSCQVLWFGKKLELQLVFDFIEYYI